MMDKKTLEVFLAYMGEELKINELHEAKDDKDALIKALLYLIFVVQENRNFVTDRFIHYLLTQFPALKWALKDNEYPITGDYAFSIVRDDDERIIVTVPKGYVEQLINKIESDDES